MDLPIAVTGTTGIVGAPLREAVRPTVAQVRPAFWGKQVQDGVSLDAIDSVTWGPGPAVTTTVVHDTARLGVAGHLTDDVRTVTGRVPVPLREFAERERAAWERGPGAPEHPAAPERNGGAP